MTENKPELTPEQTIEYLTKILGTTREKLYMAMALNIELETRLNSAQEFIESNMNKPKVEDV